jgi:hypothetical protein
VVASRDDLHRRDVLAAVDAFPMKGSRQRRLQENPHRSLRPLCV